MRVLKRLGSLLWWLTVVVVVGLAVALSAARVLLPEMSEYRAQIETLATRFVDRPVQIGSLDADWQGLSPVLKLQRVRVHDAKFPGGSLAVREVHLTLDLFSSLVQRQWRTSRLRVIGAHLSLRSLGTLGNWRNLDALAWLWQQGSIALDEISVEWTDTRWLTETLQLRDISLQLINNGTRHHLALDAGLAQNQDSRLAIMADLAGSGNDPAFWRGQIYLKADALQLQAAQPLFARFDLALQGRTDLELWAGIDQGRFDWGTGSLAVQQGRLQDLDGGTAGFAADQLDTGFRWQALDNGWQADLREFTYQRGDGTLWPASRLSLIVNRDADLRVRGSASLLVIDELHAMLPLFPWIDKDAVTMIDRLQPTGELRDADFDLEFPESALPRFAARARFDELALAASGGLPGMTGMSGRIEGNLQSGFLHLDSGSSSLRMPNLFSEPLQLSQLAGTLGWERYAESFRIRSDAIEIESGALAATARLRLDWPYRDASPWIDLQVAGDSLPLDQFHHYLPDQVMRPKAMNWLQKALQQGSVHNLRFLLQGRVDEIPFDAHQGRLEARFDFDDLRLDYHPQWGQLNDGQGSALFDGRSMRIVGNGGRIRGAPLGPVVATIADLTRPVLEIDGSVAADVSGMIEYLASTPLGARFGTAIGQFDSGGDAQLQLALKIPLKRELGKLAVNGRVELENNSLTQRDSGIAVTDISGRLQFTRDGISAKKLTGRLLGSPLVGSIYRPSGAGGDTLVDVQGRPDLVAALVAEQPALADYIRGEASWRAVLRIPNRHVTGDTATTLQLQSDLVGISSEFPAPFRKTAAKPRNLSISWIPAAAPDQPFLISYGNLVDARILPGSGRAGIEKADVRFGSGTAQLPEQQEIRIAGQLERFDLDDWLQVFNALSPARGGSAPGDAPTPTPVSVHVAVMNFFAFGHQVKDVRLDSQAVDPWHFTLQGEGAAGTLRWTPAAPAQLPHVQLALDHLLLKPVAAGSATRQDRPPHPGRLPTLDIAIADLRYAGKSLGTIGITGKPGPDGFAFDSLAMRSQAIEFAGKGSWVQHGDYQRSHFAGTIVDGRLEDLSRLFAVNSAVQGGKLSGHLDLGWDGSPAAFSLASLEGALYLKAHDGRLVDVDEGPAKLLNLISLNSLQRRLSLDFSDVVKEGFSFDTLEGRFVITDGDAFTNNFQIEGSSAIINVAGRTGLIAKDYDQLVTVIPQVSSGLPLAGAIAGGPAVGAAVFLAEKLVGKEFNRITELQYQVSGSWEDPTYERLPKRR
ncbi:MAG: YhdP family protein [Thiogranum sp.]|nr:YhdP family protein [Thiogranum sp.]